MLLALFFAQFVAAWTLPPDLRGVERIGIAVVYLVLATVVLARRRAALVAVLAVGLGIRRTADEGDA